MPSRHVCRAAFLFYGICGTTPVPAQSATQSATQSPTIDPTLYAGLKWRNIGPFRGGRCTAVVGEKDSPNTYYFGACGGGVWKTENAGTTWTNISDGQLNTGSIGAM